jgi:hypothetical protein
MGEITESTFRVRIPMRLNDRFYVAGDVRGSLSYVDVPVVEGRATMTDVSLHFFGGVGVVF